MCNHLAYRLTLWVHYVPIHNQLRAPMRFMELSSRFNSFASYYHPRLYYLYFPSPSFRCTNSKRILLCALVMRSTLFLTFVHSYNSLFVQLYPSDHVVYL